MTGETPEIQTAGAGLTDAAATGVQTGAGQVQQNAQQVGAGAGTGMVTGIENACDKVTNAAESLADNCAGGGLESGADATDAAATGAQLGEDFAGGVTSMESDAEDAGETIGTAAADALETGANPTDLASKIRASITGLSSLETAADTTATGIGDEFGTSYSEAVASQENLDAAYDAGYKLGQQTEQGIADAQKSASPSKVAQQYGRWFGQGYVYGIQDMYGESERTAAGMGTRAAGALAGAGMDRLMRRVNLVNRDTSRALDEMIARLERSGASTTNVSTAGVPRGVQNVNDQVSAGKQRVQAAGTNVQVQVGNLVLQPGQRGYNEAVALARAMDDTIVAYWPK
jgi:hypothetical protein